MHLPATSFTNNGTSLSLLRSCLVTLKQLCSFAALHGVIRWPRNCITTSQCVHNSPFPGISDKRGNSDFPAAWWPVTRQCSANLCPRNCYLPSSNVPFLATTQECVNWLCGCCQSHSTHSNLQYCFRAHSLELTAPLCIKWPIPIRGRGQYWSDNSTDTHV